MSILIHTRTHFGFDGDGAAAALGGLAALRRGFPVGIRPADGVLGQVHGVQQLLLQAFRIVREEKANMRRWYRSGSRHGTGGSRHSSFDARIARRPRVCGRTQQPRVTTRF